MKAKIPSGAISWEASSSDGKISEPLLKSIFDPHSPGHDGAVIIENDQIARFAAHLPLSKDFQQLAHVGTRHSAALGLAELSDAMCIAVSEERGKISVARNGRLRQVDNMQELGSLLQKFLQREISVRGKSRIFLFVGAGELANQGRNLFPGDRTLVRIGSRLEHRGSDLSKFPCRCENLPPNLRVEEHSAARG